MPTTQPPTPADERARTPTYAADPWQAGATRDLWWFHPPTLKDPAWRALAEAFQMTDDDGQVPHADLFRAAYASGLVNYHDFASVLRHAVDIGAVLQRHVDDQTTYSPETWRPHDLIQVWTLTNDQGQILCAAELASLIDATVDTWGRSFTLQFDTWTNDQWATWRHAHDPDAEVN